MPDARLTIIIKIDGKTFRKGPHNLYKTTEDKVTLNELRDTAQYLLTNILDDIWAERRLKNAPTSQV